MTDTVITAFFLTIVFVILYFLMAFYDAKKYVEVLKRLDKLEHEFNSSMKI